MAQTQTPKAEIYDLKYHISFFVVPRLRAFLQKHKDGTVESCPNVLTDTDREGSFEEMQAAWVEILEKMLFPFEYYNDPNAFSDLSMDARLEKEEEGLRLFAKYFGNLWI